MPCSSRKHTPIVTAKQFGAFGVARAIQKGDMPASKAGAAARAIAKMPVKTLRAHLKEAKGKKIVRKKSKYAEALRK